MCLFTISIKFTLIQCIISKNKIFLFKLYCWYLPVQISTLFSWKGKIISVSLWQNSHIKPSPWQNCKKNDEEIIEGNIQKVEKLSKFIILQVKLEIKLSIHHYFRWVILEKQTILWPNKSIIKCFIEKLICLFSITFNNFNKPI